MIFQPRYYQAAAIAALQKYVQFKRRLIVLPTGAGKAIVCALLSEWLADENPGQKVLMLVPTQELVKQNKEKLDALGLSVSTWCASIGPKKMRGDIVIGTPQSVYRNMHMFTNGNFAACVWDECHDIHPTNQAIIESLEAANEDFFTLGMTATPWRTGDGWIYGDHVDYGVTPADQTNMPFFEFCCYECKPHELIGAGFLTAPLPTMQMESYDEEGLKMSEGKYTNASLDKVIGGQSAKTQRIVAQIVKDSHDCRSVIIFAASRRHAQQICDCLPAGQWAYIDGSMDAAARKRAITSFKNFEKKYIVNVNILTTGFDHPELDHVAITRPMESSLLWQQMIGRGCRIAPGKKWFKISDFGGNVAEFFPDGDVFTPTMKVAYRGSPLARIDVECPTCGYVNKAALLNEYNVPEGKPKPYDQYGWVIDAVGEPMLLDYPYVGKKGELIPEMRQVPAHMLQRCCGVEVIDGVRVQCDHMWNFKRCSCGHRNSLSAKICSGCHKELHDVNAKLKADRAAIREVHAMEREQIERIKAEIQRIAAADPHEYRRAPVERVAIEKYITRKRETILRAVVKLPRPLGSIEVFLLKDSAQRKLLCEALFGGYIAKDNDLLRRFNHPIEWLKPRTVTHVEFKVPRSKKGYPHIRKYEVQ